jgi:hypothetical protein
MSRDIVIRRTVGLGDTAFALAAATARKAETPGVGIWYAGPPQRAEWARRCTAIEPGEHFPPSAEIVDLDRIESDTPACRSALMARRLGVQHFKPTRIAFDLPKLDTWAGHVLLTPFGGSSVVTRSFPPQVVDELATGLRRQGKIVLFARKSVWVPHSGQGPLRWTELPGMTEAQMVAIALSCRACIGVDQGISHLVGLAGIPTVIVFTHVESSARAAFHPDTTVSVDVQGVSCRPCGDFAGQPACAATQRYAECAKRISLQEVLKAYAALPS